MPAALTEPHASDIYHLREAGTPRPLTADETRQLLWYFIGDRQLAARLIERTPRAALAIVLGIGTARPLDGMTLSWALVRVFEQLLTCGADPTSFLEAQTRPAPVARDFSTELFFIEAARFFAQAGKDIPV